MVKKASTTVRQLGRLRRVNNRSPRDGSSPPGETGRRGSKCVILGARVGRSELVEVPPLGQRLAAEGQFSPTAFSRTPQWMVHGRPGRIARLSGLATH